MTIEKDAIQHLQKSANMLELEDKLQSKGTQSTLMLVPEGFKVRDLEDNMKLRDSFRFSFLTKMISDFVAYSKEFDKEGAKCFVDSDNMSAKVIFDIGSEDAPEHMRNRAKLELDKTSPYKNVLSIDGDHLAQQSASNFIEDFGDMMVITTSEGATMSTAQAANAINNITIDKAKTMTSEIGDFNSNMSAMEREDLKGSEKFPSRIAFTCKPYLGLELREFTLKVSVLTGGDRPKICMRILQLDVQKEDIVREFKEVLVEEFKDFKLNTYIGTC